MTERLERLCTAATAILGDHVYLAAERWGDEDDPTAMDAILTRWDFEDCAQAEHVLARLCRRGRAASARESLGL
jgi:hypothetical protein